MAAKKKPDPSLVVQAKDCIDLADYIMVHKNYVERMEAYREDWIKCGDSLNRVAEERDALNYEVFHDKAHIGTLERILGRLVDAYEFDHGTSIYRETIEEAKLLLNHTPHIADCGHGMIVDSDCPVCQLKLAGTKANSGL